MLENNTEALVISKRLKFSYTLDARDFSCAVSGFGQVFSVRVFGPRPNTCRPAADETKLPVAREKKPLVPRVALRG